MPQTRKRPFRLAAALFLAALAAGASAQAPEKLAAYVDLQAGFRISHPPHWRRVVPREGPVKLVLGEPAPGAALLCSVEQAASPARISTQAQLDRDLVQGFRTRAWPQELAGPRQVRDFQVRQIGGVPMGAVDWDGTREQEDGRNAYARGIKVFRPTPAGLWTAECVAAAATPVEAERHFTLNIGLVGDIIGSVRFPR